MTELVVCTGCRRHVAVRDATCPFCGAASTARPQRAVVTRIARAAIFSAALTACSDTHAPPPTPAPLPTAHGSGSDDLEKLLDDDERVVDHPAPPIDAAAAPVPVDAAVAEQPPDAGVDPALIERRRLEAKLKREREERRKLLLHEQEQVQQRRYREMAKPYGAPPARRRVV